METNQITEMLMAFGLTRQEATVYYALVQNGTMSGYEVAKQTGISRSNAYNALAGLVDKGFSYAGDGSVKKYMPLDVAEICDNKMQSLLNIKNMLVENMPKVAKETEGYLTICGYKNIEDKIRHMLLESMQRVYLEMDIAYITRFENELITLRDNNIKVVILTNGKTKLSGAKIYQTDIKQNQIGVITDSSHVLTGEFGKGQNNCCLFTGQKNFVQIFKDSLKNEIKLIEILKVKGEK